MAERSMRVNWAKEALMKEAAENTTQTTPESQVPPVEVKSEAPPSAVQSVAAPVQTVTAPVQPAQSVSNVDIKESFFSIPGEEAVKAVPDDKVRLEKELMVAQSERMRLEEKLRVEREIRDKAAQERDELKAWRREQELNREFSLAGTEFSSIDPDDAEKMASITRKSHATLSEELKLLREQIEQSQAEQQRVLKEQAMYAKEAVSSELRANTNKKILQAYPDFDSLSKTSQFQSMLSQATRPGSHITNKDELGMAYAAGDADYIVSFLKERLGNQPQFDKIAQVGSAPVDSSVKEHGVKMSEDEQLDLLTAVKTGVISREEFRKQRQALTSAGKS